MYIFRPKIVPLTTEEFLCLNVLMSNARFLDKKGKQKMTHRQILTCLFLLAVIPLSAKAFRLGFK